MNRSSRFLSLLLLIVLLNVPQPALAAGPRAASIAPVFVGPVPVGANLVILPDGVWEAYQAAAGTDGFKLTRLRSTDEGRSWSMPVAVHLLPGENWGGTVTLLDRRGEVHVFFMRSRIEGTQSRIAIDLCIDIWHLRSLNRRQSWSEPQRIFKGYTGSVEAASQLSSGRIVLPFGSWIAGRPADPPRGRTLPPRFTRTTMAQRGSNRPRNSRPPATPASTATITAPASRCLWSARMVWPGC